MFQVTTMDLNNIPHKEDGSIDYTQDFFGKPTNLTVSGQLNGETFALAFKNIYTFGPTFRAENSNTTRHAAEFWMIGCAMALLLGNILIFAAYQYIQQMNQRYMDLRLQQQKEQADRSYYKTLQEQYDNQRVMIHDIRHHLAVIKEMAEVQNGKIVANYVSEMGRLPALQQRVQYCKDPVLNTLLIRYRDLCQERGISFSADIRKCAIEGMDSIDITSLFGNLMENALEAAQGSENPFLEVSLDVREAQKAWVLTIVNSCKEPPEALGMSFISRKQKRERHGIGLMSVKRIMKKYKGNLEQYYEENDKTFHSVVVFPVNLSK